MVLIRAFGRLSQAWHSHIAPYPRLKRTLYTLYWLPIGVVFTDFFYTVKIVTGSSMRPTLNPDSSSWRDVVILDCYSIRAKHEYVRGDIVTLKHPVTRELIVKRIIALRGDVVRTLPPYPDYEVVIPEGHAWFEGDDPFRSEDSNTFGPVPLGLVDSRLHFIIWPPSRFGPLLHRTRLDSSTRGSPGGGNRRQDVGSIEREKWRSSRVKVRRDE